MPVVDISCWPYLVVQPLCSYSECDCSPTRRWAQEQSGEQRHFLINTLSLIICSLYHTRGYWVFLHCSAEHNHLLHFHFWQHQHDFLFKTWFRKKKNQHPLKKKVTFSSKANPKTMSPFSSWSPPAFRHPYLHIVYIWYLCQYLFASIICNFLGQNFYGNIAHKTFQCQTIKTPLPFYSEFCQMLTIYEKGPWVR